MATINISPTGTNDGTALNTAISGASSGDVLLLAEGTYDIDTTVLMAAGITLKGVGRNEVILQAASGFGSAAVVYSNAVNTTTVETLTIDGNGEANTNGLQFRNSDGHTATDVLVKDCGGPQIGVYGVNGFTGTRLETSAVTGLTGTSHGFDVGIHTTTESQNITLNDCTFENGERDSLKAEECTSVIANDCTFNWADVVLGDTALSNVGITFNRCTFNAEAGVNQINTGQEPVFNDCIFTAEAGCIVARYPTARATANNCTFYGRNKFVAFDPVTPSWFTMPATMVDNNSTHPGKTEGGYTVFISPNGTGSPRANTEPYITPATAGADPEGIPEDTRFHTDILDGKLHYAFRSDKGEIAYTASDGQILPATGVANLYFEGYPGRAVIDLTSAPQYFIRDNIGNITGNCYVRDFHLKNLDSTGRCLQFDGSNYAEVRNVTISDNGTTNAGIAGAGIEIRDGATVDVINCLFENMQGSGTADGCVMTITGTASTANVIGCKFRDVTTTRAGAVRITAVAHTVTLIGNEFIRCDSSGAAGALWIQAGSTLTFGNNTFVGNAGTRDDVLVEAAYTFNNSIFSDVENIGPHASITVTNCLIGTATAAGLTDGGGTQFSTTPTYKDAANDNYNLASNSAGVSEGGKYWTGPNPVGANLEPFSDIDTDIGANQSPYGPFHPTKL